MNYPKNKIIAIAFVASILISNFVPLYAIEVISNNEIKIEKLDSAKTSKTKNPVVKKTVDNQDDQKVKSSPHLTYNFIYYLISIFIKRNPLAMPR